MTRINLLPLLAFALVLAGCRSTSVTAGPSVAASSEAAVISAAPSAQATDAVTVWGGVHYVTATDGIGWILTKPTYDRLLFLTRLSLVDGGAVTNLVDDQEECCFGPSVAADNAGYLWFTHLHQILRLDPSGGPVQRWELPEAAPDASPSDEDPAASGVGAAGWDPLTNTLLFIRFSDHRLYRFDPTIGAFSTVVDLPIITHNLSEISVGIDGTVAINGGMLGATTFAPTAVVLAPDRVESQVIPDTLAVCLAGDGPMTLDQAGVVRSGTSVRGQVEFTPHSDVAFVCDSDGNAFSVGLVSSPDGAAADIVISRFASDGDTATREIPYTLVHGQNPHDGTPMDSWLGPNFQTLLPDDAGGVWLMNQDGTVTPDSGMGYSLYPSFMRIRF